MRPGTMEYKMNQTSAVDTGATHLDRASMGGIVRLDLGPLRVQLAGCLTQLFDGNRDVRHKAALGCKAEEA